MSVSVNADTRHIARMDNWRDMVRSIHGQDQEHRVGKPLQPKVQRWASCGLANICAVFCIELRASPERMLANGGHSPILLNFTSRMTGYILRP